MAFIQELFDSFEAQMVRLHGLAGLSPPLMAEGPTSFFTSLNTWFATSEARDTIVLPDPSLNLSLPYPEDELRLASRDPTTFADPLAQPFLERFGLDAEILRRPVSALSGGERMLVSLMKGTLLTTRGQQLIVCSPFFWLDPEHRALVTSVLNDRHEAGINIRLMSLQGENEPSTSTQQLVTTSPELEWQLTFDQSTVRFPACTFPRQTNEKQIRFTLRSPASLRSPTLISGANGIGKTTFAKLLAGLLRPKDRRPQIAVRGFGGHARLLMQDALLHLFGSTPGGHLDRVLRHDKSLAEGARTLFRELQNSCASSLSAINAEFTIGNKNVPNSVFQAKLALVCERLIGGPPLLILDEPSWCLSKDASRVFMQEIVKAAHARKTAVAVISHNADWWQGMMAGHLRMEAGKGLGEVCLVA